MTSLALTGPEFRSERAAVDLTVWLADLTYTQAGVSAETMPQAVGGLATYAASTLDLRYPVRIFKYPEVLARAFAEHGAPDVIGFSHYIWNSTLSLAFAARIRACFPETTVVFGGPHYPVLAEEQQSFWRERLSPVVDYYVEGEGEHAFGELLAALAEHGRDSVHGKIAGVHSRDATGRLHLPAVGPRMVSLAAVPSPYVAGLMDEFFDGQLVPTVQTNRGCPFSCTFCVEGTRYFSRVAKKHRERVAEELHYIGERMAPLVADGRGRNELLITDSNFGMFPEDIDTCDVIAECQRAYGWPRYVNVTTGKNKRDRVLDAVSRTHGAITLSGAVQSLDPGVLGAVKRSNIDADGLMDVALAAAERNTPTYSEVILGLPEDSKTKHFHSLDELIRVGFGRINMFQLSLLPGSDLCSAQARTQHGMTTRWRVMPRCFGTYELLGTQISTAEVDEICVTLPSMSYADYRACRRMNMWVASCYNDSPLAALVAVLRSCGASVFRWLEWMDRLRPGPVLARIVEEFQTNTDRQLWEDRETLQQWAAENIDRYVTGDLGANVIYTARARMLTGGLDDLIELAAWAARRTVSEADVSDPQVYGFIAEAAEYHRLCLTGVLTATAGQALQQPARFDIDAFLRQPTPGSVRDVLLEAPAVRRFTLTAAQSAVVEGYLAKFGASAAGAGRLLTKVRLLDLVRQRELIPAPTSPVRPPSSTGNPH